MGRQRYLRVVNSFDDDEFVIRLIVSHGKDTKVYCRDDHTILYIDTPHSRYVSAQGWNMDSRELMEFANENGDGMSYISPSSFAYSLYSKKYAPESFYMLLDGFKSVLSRRAVYGGRCEVYKQGKAVLNKYDINSSYPSSAIALRFPDPRRMIYAKFPTISNIAQYEGVSTIIFSQQEQYPSLPIRRDGRVLYANLDQCEGTYTHNEIRYALEMGQIELHGITKQYTCSGEIDAFTGFVRYCWDKRVSSGNKVWKMIMNSLIGRMAMMPDGLSCYTVLRKSSGDNPESYALDKIKRIKGGNKFVLMGGNEVTSYFTRSNPLWAAMILADARTKLHRAIIIGRSMVYADTDCIITSDDRDDLTIGLGLGEWKHLPGEYNIKRVKGYEGPEGVKLSGISPKDKRVFFGKAHYTNERVMTDSGDTVPYSFSNIRGTV